MAQLDKLNLSLSLSSLELDKLNVEKNISLPQLKTGIFPPKSIANKNVLVKIHPKRL